MNSTNIYITLKKASHHYWQTRARVVKVTRNRPTSLKAGEVAVEVVIKTPDNFFETPKISVELTPTKAHLPT